MANFAKPQGVQYTKAGTQTEYQLFPESYFSGADVKIYFGDVLVDEIAGLSFMLQEQVRPLYSYASYTYKEVARGNRIVQGKFYVNFTEAGYVSGMMDHIGQFKDTDRGGQISGAYNETLSSLYENGKRLDFRARALQSFENLLVETVAGQINNAKTEEEKALIKSTAANRYFTSYEREIWGRDASLDKTHETMTYFFRSRTGTFNTSNIDYQHYLKKNGFDIYITYGPLEEALTETVGEHGRNLSNKQVAVSFNTTVKAIRGVQLLGVSQEVMGDNQVVEVFDFLARDCD